MKLSLKSVSYTHLDVYKRQPFMHKYIKEKFPSAKNGKVDLAIPFIEKSINLLNEEGRLGLSLIHI